MKCILCIPTRNTAPYLNKIFNNIKILKGVFTNFVACFLYDISHDNTLKILNDFKKENNYVEILENKEPLLQYRTHRIANARNKLLEFISDNYADADFFIMMDSDEICCRPIDSKILTKYLKIDTWDALSFNRFGLPHGNYDIWALQYEPFIHHCHSYNGCLDVVFAMRNDITHKLNSLKNGELFECYSAFNGFSIYRTNKFLNIKYDGEIQKYFSDERIKNMLEMLRNKVNKNLSINFDYVDISHGGGKQNCEHIGFHINAIRKNNARIRISGERIFK